MHWAIRRKKTTMGRKKLNVLTVSHNLKKKSCTSLRIKTIVWREKSWDYRCNFEKKSHNLKVSSNYWENRNMKKSGCFKRKELQYSLSHWDKGVTLRHNMWMK